jgi:hypothetical protein
MNRPLGRKALIALAGLCLILATICSRCNDTERPPAGGDYSVTLGGKTLTVHPLSTYAERHSAFARYGNLPKDSAVLIMHPRDRYLAVGIRETFSGTFRVDFLDASGKIVDTQFLEHFSEEGVNSKSEARYALLTRPLGLTAKVGEMVVLSPKLREIQPAENPVLKINGTPIYVELSTNDHERQRGLMFRYRMSKDDGMLFAYPGADHHSFWMRNTMIPLSLAYILPDGTISQLVDMQMYANPRTDQGSFPSNEKVQYVLEVNLGYFKDHGLKEGMKIEFPPELKEYPPE